MPGAVCIYVDNSNLFIEGQRIAERQGENRYGLRIHFENLIRVFVRDRQVREVVWGGSIPPPDDTVWSNLRAMNITPDLIERSQSGENETVDNRVQLRMHRHARKYRGNEGTICLATGDGKGYHNEEGFLFDVEGLVEDGWEIEIYSWTHCCHQRLREFAEQNGKFIPLDPLYSIITFIQNGRRSLRFDLDSVLDVVDPIR